MFIIKCGATRMVQFNNLTSLQYPTVTVDVPVAFVDLRISV